MAESKPPFPPFTEETARAKVKAAENAWNTRNPDVVALAYTEDSDWRNRTDFFKGREAIREFLRKKWSLELDYRLMKELWAFTGNKIAVRFEYEWRNEAHQWYETIGVLIYMLQPAVEMGLIFCELKNRKLNYGHTLTLCKYLVSFFRS